MRDIKFRIWDGAKNEWLASSNKDALPYYGFALVGEVMTVQSPPVWSLDEGNVVEQFTNLKDKNGTEIYEGDIIQFEFWNEKYYRQIAYNSAIASYEAITVTSPTSKKLRQKAKYSFSELYKISSKGFKVVGNIHENPELLEEK